MLSAGTIDTVSAVAMLSAGTIDTVSAVAMLSAGTIDTVSAISAGENHLGEVGGNIISIAQTPTIGTVEYAAGDAVDGTLTFANAARVSGGSGEIVSVIVIDDDKESAALDLVLFDQAFTATADNAAFAVSDADLENFIGSINIPAANYAAFDDNSAATVRDVGLGFVADATTLYGQLVSRGTPTYAAVNDLTVKVVIKRN